MRIKLQKHVFDSFSNDVTESVPEKRRFEDLGAVRLQNAKQDVESESIDPMLHVNAYCVELILHHLRCRQLLSLGTVSKSWHKIIGNSHVAMKQTSYNLNCDSKGALERSSRNYQSIKVKQDIENPEPDFLLALLKFITTLRFLSIEGKLHGDSIAEFFYELNLITNVFNLQHLTFIGNVGNIETILENFSLMKTFDSLTMSEVSSRTFSTILKFANTKKLILKNMNLSDPAMNEYQYRQEIQKLHMSRTKCDRASLEAIFDFCPNIKTVSFDDFESLDEDVKILIESHSNNMRVEAMPKPRVIDIIVQLPEPLHEMIIQHLSHEELMDTSEVSTTWFNFTKKFICDRSIFNLESRHDRKRNYGNFHATINEDLISLNNFFPIGSCLKEACIEVLPNSVRNVKFLFTIRNFPNLTMLNLACHENATLDNLKFPTTLKVLHLSNFTFRSEKPETTQFFKFLTQAKHLIDLQFFACSKLENLFNADVSESVSFKLQSLRIPFIECFSQVDEKFNKFLKTQSESMEMLSLAKVNINTICNLCDGFKLKSFGFLSISGLVDDLINRKCSMETVEEIQIPLIAREKQVEVLDPYLKLAPNMKTLCIQNLTDVLLTHLRESFKLLEEIRYAHNKLSDSEEFYGMSCKGIKLIQDDLLFDEFDAQNNQRINE